MSFLPSSSFESLVLIVSSIDWILFHMSELVTNFEDLVCLSFRKEFSLEFLYCEVFGLILDSSFPELVLELELFVSK